MEKIKTEFENYLKGLVESYPTTTNTILQDPSSLNNVGIKSRDYNAKVQNKIQELASKNPHLTMLYIKMELTELITRYHSKLMSGHL
jgi:hypothetical protein